MRNPRLLSLLLLLALGACTQESQPEQAILSDTIAVVGDPAELADVVLQARHQHQLTDVLSTSLPEMDREQAISIQLAMLDTEIAQGEKLIGYKMGGTAVPDSASYDPMFGYMLASNLIAADSLIQVAHFPGGNVMVEAEIGFRIKTDFPAGVQSMEALKAGIDYVFPAVEFAKSVAVPAADKPESMNINHVLASGLGHAGIILGEAKVAVSALEMELETVQCMIQDTVAATGGATNLYGGPLGALYDLANQLPLYGRHLEAGQIVITGSLYPNPTVGEASDIRVVFRSLGEISFQMQ